jgi:hypothetical protein
MINYKLIRWPPDRVLTGERSFVGEDALVGQFEWCHLIPQLHSALANPDAATELPEYNPDAQIYESCAYWETAVYLLHYLIGWSDPGAGLQWWYASGQEDYGDPRLQLLKKVWNSHDQLDYLAMWFWKRGYGVDPLLDEMCILSPTTYTKRPEEDFLESEWWQELERRITNTPCSNHPMTGCGGNELHLGHSSIHSSMMGGVHEASLNGTFSYTSEKQRTASLILDRAENWYASLAAWGKTLPDIGNRSWKVDVVVKPIGWLGTFRRSRQTGLWFQGRHLIHQEGN